jgi:hypothetical protein
VVTKATRFWRLCWNQTPLLKLLLKFSNTCELRIFQNWHSLTILQSRRQTQRAKEQEWERIFNCVLKSIDIYIVQINTLAFEGFRWSSLDFCTFQSFWRFGDHWARIYNVDHMTSKVQMGKDTTGSNCIQWCEEESHSFHILWNISVACAVGPSANLLPNWFLLSELVFVTLLNFQWLKAL